MPELRRDLITHRWVIIATERALRPKDFKNENLRPPKGRTCPFCPGHESLTPPEILRYPALPQPWQVRVVPNKFPALRIEGDLEKRPEGIFDRMNGIGAHEVIIECPDHDFALHALTPPQMLAALKVYRTRLADLRGDPRFRYGVLFRNHGEQAGASIAHGHAQLIALPVVPAHAQELLEGAERYWRFHDRNVFEDILRQEIDDGRRLVFDNAHFALVTPYASRFPFEMWIIPKAHGTRFEDVSNEHLAALGEVLTSALSRLHRGLGDPPYNFILHNSPYGQPDVPWYRWHIVIMPTLTKVAGFEWGTGFYINPTSPEESAEFLRSQRT
ncbi:MAG: galactose-1-phosphate uridylyltransferase [Myxococcales bacterium]|nr:galactose-1-phosphate uridylyltransferase [Myxococcales bacterium]